MAQPIIIPFGEWLPDLPPYQNPGATIAKNVRPDIHSYRPFPNTNTVTQALGGRAQGSVFARDSTGTNYNYAGDASALYALSLSAWTNISRLSGGAYTTTTDDFWEFDQFGNVLLAVNGRLGDVPQAISLGTANFAALGGAPPKASHIGIVRNFGVLGNISGAPQTVQWSALGNIASWTPDAATLADFQDLPGQGGDIQKVIGGEYGTIFQERAIFRMTFVGSPTIFQFDQVHRNIGAYLPQAVASYQNLSFFLSEDGFYMFDGAEVTPIGRHKVDRTFYNDLDASNQLRVMAAIDPINKVVIWAYPASGNSGGNPNRLLMYNWASKRWSRIEDLNIQLLTRLVTTGYTLDGLDAISTNLDDLPNSLDSSRWQGGIKLLAAFNSANRLITFDASAMPATVETSEQRLNPDENGIFHISQIRPITEGVLSGTAQIAITTRNVLTESVTTGAAVSTSSAGFAEVRSTARYHRIRVTTTSNVTFDHLQGVEITGNPAGRR